MFAIYIFLFSGLCMMGFDLTIAEKLPNRYDSRTKLYTFVRINPQKSLNEDILSKEVEQNQKMFDTMKEELYSAKRRNFEKRMGGNRAFFKRNAPPETPSAESVTSSAKSPATITTKLPIDLEKRINTIFEEEKDFIPKTHHRLFREKIRCEEENKDLRDQVSHLKTNLESSIRYEEENKDLRNQVTILKTNLSSTEHELKRIKAPLSVRKRIEYLEIMITPGYKETKQFTSTKEAVGFHEERWLYILTHKTDDPIVKRILQFIADNAWRGMTKEVFARRIAGFFHFTSNKIHVPALESYSSQELKSELEAFFGDSFDDFTFDIVCLLKNLKDDPTATLKSMTISNSPIFSETM